MRALTFQLSAAAALATVFLQLMAEASIEHTLVTAAGIGLSSAVVLTSVGSAVRAAKPSTAAAPTATPAPVPSDRADTDR